MRKYPKEVSDIPEEMKTGFLLGDTIKTMFLLTSVNGKHIGYRYEKSFYFGDSRIFKNNDLKTTRMVLTEKVNKKWY